MSANKTGIIFLSSELNCRRIADKTLMGINFCLWSSKPDSAEIFRMYLLDQTFSGEGLLIDRTASKKK